MTIGFVSVNPSGTAGSYGGLGGSASGAANPLYGNSTNPNEVGSGGGGFQGAPAGNGGGLARIAAQSIVLNGAVRANGGVATQFSAGGSGGGIRIDVGTLSGSGSISANGSPASPVSGGGGGGGGRVAVYHQTATTFNLSNITALGGTGSNGPNGQNGTVHVQQQTASLSPELFEAPVMRAATGKGEHIRPGSRVPTVDSPEASERGGGSGQSKIQNQKSKVYENLYLAMVGEGKIKAFASTAVTAERSGASEIPRASFNPTPVLSKVEVSKVENPKLDDTDPIYAYDLNGNRTSMIDPTGLTTYTHDALNRLTSITNNKGITTTFTYDALGRRTSMTHGNGVVTSYTYDAASQLLTLAHQFGATTINSLVYTYDKVGNRKSKADNTGAANYSYDVLNRLTQAVNPLPSNPLETFNYDGVGNRTDSNQNGFSSFNQANQLLEDANFTYQYDNNGNLTLKTPKVSGPITSYEYDAENKLVRVVSNGTTVNYKYDGLGRRVEKEAISAGTAVTRYVYDKEDILLELDGSNNIVARYTHGPGIDEPLVMEKNTQFFYYHADGIGSISELTSQSGTVAQRYAYSSFGRIESQFDPNFIQPYTYTSREFDAETGLYYYRARTYDSLTGRFVQEDPLSFAAGVNFYRYVGNNPVNFTDPTGLISKCCIGETPLQILAVGAASAWTARELVTEAHQVTRASGLPGSGDGQADAFRHCYWSCRMAQEIGPERAKAAGDVHEECDFRPNVDNQKAMDLHNNAVGRAVGASGGNCIRSCLHAVLNGTTQNSPGGRPPQPIY
jgi:RHS repeat-associated protein